MELTTLQESLQARINRSCAFLGGWQCVQYHLPLYRMYSKQRLPKCSEVFFHRWMLLYDQLSLVITNTTVSSTAADLYAFIKLC